jgi:NADH-quinone oxidoreductase subunit E
MITQEKIELSAAAKAAIDKELLKYPAEKKRAAVMAALTFVQQENQGYLTPALMDAVAEYLELPPIQVYEVATFYSLYELKPVGKYKLQLCTNVPCMLGGAEEIGEYLQKKLHIEYGETTADGQFTLREVECLGACISAPVMQINREYYTEKLTEEGVDELLEELSKK